MTTERRYVQFPISLLREIHIDKNAALNKILRYGIYRYSKMQEVNEIDVVRQLIYLVYRGKLGSEIRKELSKFEFVHLGADDDYNGFIGGGFEPMQEEFDEVISAFSHNEKLKELSFEFYRMHVTKNSLGISGDTFNILKEAKKVELMIREKEPFGSITTKMIFEYRDKPKSEFDIIQLCAFIALRSILGKNQSCTTNNNLLIARMLGYFHFQQLKEEFMNEHLEIHFKYSKRRQMNKLFIELDTKWNILKYSSQGIRGFNISMKDEMSYQDLAYKSESKKQKVKEQKYKAKKDNAKQAALDRIKNENRKV